MDLAKTTSPYLMDGVPYYEKPHHLFTIPIKSKLFSIRSMSRITFTLGPPADRVKGFNFAFDGLRTATRLDQIASLAGR